MLAIGLTWLSIVMTPSAPIWQLVLPFIVLGCGMAFIWAPLAATATRNLPPRLAGAGSGTPTTQPSGRCRVGQHQHGLLHDVEDHSEMPPMPGGDALQSPPGGKGTALQMPEFLREPFSAAMCRSMLLPGFIALFGVAAALFMMRFAGSGPADDQRSRADAGDREAGRRGWSERDSAVRCSCKRFTSHFRRPPECISGRP